MRPLPLLSGVLALISIPFPWWYASASTGYVSGSVWISPLGVGTSGVATALVSGASEMKGGINAVTHLLLYPLLGGAVLAFIVVFISKAHPIGRALAIAGGALILFPVLLFAGLVASGGFLLGVSGTEVAGYGYGLYGGWLTALASGISLLVSARRKARGSEAMDQFLDDFGKIRP